MSNLRVTVSGSFHRHIQEVQDAVARFAACGANVLSPADPRIVDAFGAFVFVASDLRRSIRGIQNRHMEAIRNSDLLWLVCPDGYVGSSASMEVGFATAVGTPVFASSPPSDITIRQYVQIVSSLEDAILLARPNESFDFSAFNLLLDPHGTVAFVHEELESIHTGLTTSVRSEGDPVESRIDRAVKALTSRRRS